MADMDIRSKLTFEVEDREFDKHKKSVREYSSTATKEVAGAHGKIERSSQQMAASMRAAWVGITAFLGSQVIRVLLNVQRKLFDLATAAEETASKFAITFGDQQKNVDEFVNTFGRLAGLTRTEGREITATLGAVAQGFGDSKSEAAGFAMQVVRAGADMSSFNNTRLPDMLTAIRSGLAGEIEPLRRYGIELSAADVQQKAMETTGIKVVDQLTQQHLTYARLALIQEQAALQMGDLERTQNSLSNQWRRLTGNIRQQAEEYAVTWIPAMTAAVSAANALFSSSTELAGAVKTARAEIQQLGSVEAAIDTFERLHGQTKLTADENEELAKAVKVLEEQFPGYIKETNDAGEAVSFYTDALRGAVAQQIAFNRLQERDRIGDLAKSYREAAKDADEMRQAQQHLNEILLDPKKKQQLEGRAFGFGGEMIDVRRIMSDVGQEAATFEAKTRDAARALAGLFETAEGVDMAGLRDALAAAGFDIVEASRVALQVVTQAKAIRSAAGTDEGGKPDSGGDPETPAATIEAAREALRKITEAHAVAARASDEEKKKLQEIFSLQEQIAEIERLKKTLGSEAVREQEEFARLRLHIVRLELAAAEELRKRIAEAAAEFAGMVGRGTQGPVEAAGFKPEEKATFADLIDDGRISGKALIQIPDGAIENLERVVGLLDKARDEGEDLDEVFRGIASSLRSVTRFVDIFGDLPEHTRRAADGIADVLDNVSALSSLESGASFLQKLPGIVGIVAGAGSIIAGVIGALGSNSEAREREMEALRRQQEEQERLREALLENARRVTSAVDRFAKAAQFGSDVSGSQAAAASDLIRNLMEIEGQLALGPGMRFDPATGRMVPEDPAEFHRRVMASIESTIKMLEETGIPEFEGLFDLFQSLPGTLADKLSALLTGDLPAGFEDFTGLEKLLELLGAPGGFADSVDGAIASLQFFTKFLNADLPAQFDHFMDALLQGVSGLTPELKAMLEEASGLDLTSAEGRARLQEIIAMIAAAAPGLLGGLTPAELEAILDQLTNFAESAAGGGSDEFSRGVQIARSITEIQANELVALGEEQVYLLGQMLEALRALAKGSGIGFLPRNPITIPDNLAGAINHVMTPMLPAGTREAMEQGGVSINGTNINIATSKSLDQYTEADWDKFARKIGGAIADQVKAKVGRHGRMSF